MDWAKRRVKYQKMARDGEVAKALTKEYYYSYMPLEDVEHNCGLVGVVDMEGNRNVLPDALLMAEALEHRGQGGWGRAGIDDEKNLWVRHTKGAASLGVTEAIRTDPRSSTVLAHTRYGTSLGQNLELIHPVLADIVKEGVYEIGQSVHSQLAFAFNGNVPNFSDWSQELAKNNIAVKHKWDTEVLAKLLANRIALREGDVRAAIYSLGEKDAAINGGLLMPDGEIYAWRNKEGTHPLVVAEWDGKIAFASEDRAVKEVWTNFAKIRDVRPGEMVHLNAQKQDRRHELWDAAPRHCAFEWIYFAKWLSNLDRASVEAARYMLGEMLAQRDGGEIPADALIGAAPDSALKSGQGYAGFRFNDMKRRFVDLLLAAPGRTFIESELTKQEKIEKKYTIDPNLVRGRPFVLVDDSIVTGDTMRFLTDRIWREACPSELHLRIASPPVLNPCFDGVDMKTMDKLFARRHFHGSLPADGMLPKYALASMARELNVTSIKYLCTADIPKAIGIAFNELCMACMNGDYPMKDGQRLYEIALADLRGARK